MAFEIKRVAPDEQRGKSSMNDGRYRTRQIIGLSQPDQAVIGIDADPQIVGQNLASARIDFAPLSFRQRLEPDGLDFCDLHIVKTQT